MSDRSRSLLHKNKLDKFIRWAQGRGYIVAPPTGHAYEVLRLQLHNPAGIEEDLFYYRRERGEHLTCTGEGLDLVKKFLSHRS